MCVHMYTRRHSHSFVSLIAMANGNAHACTTDCCCSSNSSDGNELSTANFVQYGPIQVRVCRKLAPTLATGRRSKHLTLYGDEAIRREKRREKNRLAAKKLKEKRQLIEDELNKELHVLQGEHTDLQGYLADLRQQKQFLESQWQRLCPESVDRISTSDTRGMSTLLDQYLGEFDLYDHSIESLFTGESNDV
jgi:hypothetical protein